MSGRRATWLAWSLWGLFVALMVGGKIIQYHSHVGGQTSASDYVLIVGFALFPSVGAVVASRRPENTIGWLYLAIGLLAAGSYFAGTYATFGIHRHPASPGTVVAEMIGNTLWYPTLGVLATFAVLLFPTGHLPLRRWRPAAWVAGVGNVVLPLSFALSPGPLDKGSRTTRWGSPGLKAC